MRLSRVLANEAVRSAGAMVITPCPSDRQPMASTINRIEWELAAQLRANNAMRIRSMYYAGT